MANEQPAAPKTAAEAKNIADQIIGHITAISTQGSFKVVPNYAVENALRAAWLQIQETTNMDNVPALQCCTTASIQNAMMRMVSRGLTTLKDQGYFIVFGNKLTWMDSYLGTIATARRLGVLKDISPQVIYADDVFEQTIDITRGRKMVTKHEQKFQNIDLTKIIGAYCIITPNEGEPYAEIMTMAQIKAAWEQGYAKGKSPAHTKFPDQMAMKTVCSRACKMLVSTTDDSTLFNDEQHPAEDATYELIRTEIKEKGNGAEIGFEGEQPSAGAAQQIAEPVQVSAAPAKEPQVVKKPAAENKTQAPAQFNF